MDFASVESYSVRNDRCLFPEVWDLKKFGWITRWIGLQFNRDTDELDDSVIENLFESDCESEFEGFVVYGHRTFYLNCTQCSDDIQATSSAVSKNNAYELLLW